MMYEWVRAAHIIFVIAWMAGMLMLPRLIVYQIEAEPQGELFTKMDEAIKRLRHIILTPTMTLAWILGLAMIAMRWPEIMSQGWLHLKLLLVLIISGFHGYFVGLSKKVSGGTSSMSPKTLRVLNEVPFVLMIFAVIAVVIQPFG